MQAFKRTLGVRASANMDDEILKPWKPVLGSMSLPRHTIVLSEVNPKTQQSYSIAPPKMLEDAADNPALCNLALCARGFDFHDKENRNSNGGGENALPHATAGLVFCNAFEMQLASTFIYNAFKGPKGAIRWDNKLKRSVLDVPGVKAAHLQEAIRSFHSGHMCVDSSNVDALLWTASRLGIERLVEGLLTYLTTLDVVAAAPREVCQLVTSVGREDVVPRVIEKVRNLFWRLPPQKLAALLAWLPTEQAVHLLNLESLQVVSELQICEALLLLPGATSWALLDELSSQATLSHTTVSCQTAIALWRCVRFTALRRAELFSLHGHVGELLQLDTRRLVMRHLAAAWDGQLEQFEAVAEQAAQAVDEQSNESQASLGAGPDMPTVSPQHHGPSPQQRRTPQPPDDSNRGGFSGKALHGLHAELPERSSCRHTLYFTVPRSRLQTLLQAPDEFASWHTPPQQAGGVTLRLSITRTAPSAPTSADANGSLSQHGRHSSSGSLADSTHAASTPNSTSSQTSRPPRRLLGRGGATGTDPALHMRPGNTDMGSGRKYTRAAAPLLPHTPLQGRQPSLDNSLPEGRLSGPLQQSSRQVGGPPPWRSITSRRSPQQSTPSPPPEPTVVQPRSQLSYAPGVQRPKPSALKTLAERPRPLWLDDPASSSGTRSPPARTPTETQRSNQGSISPEVRGDAAFEGQQPQRIAHMEGNSIFKSPNLHSDVDKLQIKQRSGSNSNSSKSFSSFLWGVQLLAESTDADATVDAGRETATPLEQPATFIESFDVFCLAQKTEGGEGTRQPPEPRLIGALTSFEVPYEYRRTLGCGPVDWLSRALDWPPAWSDGSSRKLPFVTIGIHVHYAATAPSAAQVRRC